MARIMVAVPAVAGGAAAGDGRPGAFESAGPPVAAAVPARVVSASASGGETAEPRYLALGYGAVVVGAAAGIGLYAATAPAAFAPNQGFDSFAVLYIVTQTLERLFEPVATWVRGSAAGSTESKAEAVQTRDDALAAVRTSPATADDAVATAAGAQARVDQVRKNAAVLIWGLQSALGMLLAGWLGILLLRGIGAAGVPPAVDIVVTGLAIGGGSKALHELIKSAQTSKEQKQDPAEAGGTV